MINYKPGSMGNKILKHDNNYVFEVSEVVNRKVDTTPSISVLIPYYNASETINLVFKHLLQSLEYTSKHFKKFEWEIILIDDGSDIPATEIINKDIIKNLKVIELKENKGTCYARNIGIAEARSDIIMFIDADVLISRRLIYEHLKVHQYLKSTNLSGITVSLFNFLQLNKEIDINDSQFEDINDFRKFCVYQESWIGCQKDLEFTGKKFEIMKQTNNLKDWPKSGYLGPWVISNMVLGGLFTISRSEAKAVGGCSRLFSSYGFEETSLVSKIIARYNSFVIPIVTSNSIHLEIEKPGMDRNTKNKLFQRAHNLYFKSFLKQDINNMNEQI